MAHDHPSKRTRCWWWEPRLSFANPDIRLDKLCLHALMKHVSTTASNAGRNSRQKKALQAYFSNTLPVSLQACLLESASANLADFQTMLDLLYMLKPMGNLASDSVDLVGSLRYAVNLELGSPTIGTYTRWYPFFPLTPLTSDQLTQLYNILLWTKNIQELKQISIAVEAGALKITNFSHIFARAISLTRVVILEGADNHTLRILGCNCPQLKHVDVSHSWTVSDVGLLNLLLKRPPRRQPRTLALRITSHLITWTCVNSLTDHLLDKNPCASCLECLILTGTQVSAQGCDFACKSMGSAHLLINRPLVKIARMKIPRSTLRDNRVLERIIDTTLTVINVLPVGSLMVECFEPPRNPDENPTYIAYTRVPHSGFVDLAFKIEGAHVTALSLPFYALSWEFPIPGLPWDLCVSLELLADNFPNLTWFQGRVQGKWDYSPQVTRRLVHLVKATFWARSSASAISILDHCSSLKYIQYNHLAIREEGENDDDGDDPDRPFNEKLTHNVLLNCFTENPSLGTNLEEVTIRPGRCLGIAGLNTFVKKCKNLRKIGDLHAWNVTKGEVEQVSKMIKESGRCLPVLSLFSTPPSPEEAKEWDSWMPFD